MRRHVIGAAAALLLGSGAALAGPGIAQATTQFCDQDSPQICAFANGTNGHGVFARPLGQGSNIGILFAKAPNCGGTSNVQDGQDGDDNCPGQSNFWWPFTTHSLDTSNDAGSVTEINSGDCVVAHTDLNVYQDASCGYGHLWVRKSATNAHFYVNVAESDHFGNNNDLCTVGGLTQLFVKNGCSLQSSEWDPQ